jgi:multidrug efflux pump subunit AcrB
LNIGRLEDPAFTIKTAVVVTHYPGASAQQVEEEVTLPLENALQQLPYLDNVSSISSNGLSQITVNIHAITRTSCRRFGMNCAAAWAMPRVSSRPASSRPL